ncbi:imidazole glycerol phosphate synthase subunit HisH [Methylocystis bryophila]|uniref:Imidazole glycerol phosphate synthase subunit HisH n=1 Tax=Methylocystis bryophila TaxID=655015 RepID=A0A1W6MQR7_9HYPH|nr:imidazole glycerol phosphate synthase subunit HisH [Methylocystis bryophila]ARN79927.1 imidazole glycerol phosphate synthase subunit HisH [Methylocystis bryophila]BDV39825.1 imidazole glycerol phosphate synthase subunit HisH [Methylocystis bryophila]
MTTAIIDYGSGNLHSAVKAFERAAREAGLDETIRITDDPEIVRQADRLVLPGVGAFADCRAGLARIPGLIDALSESARARGRPFLGICVGMQLLATRGLEHGETQGFNWIEGEVDAIRPDGPALKIPHMGWNTLELTRAHPLFSGTETGERGLHAYFVHSYYFRAARAEDVLATASYGGPVTAAVARDNLVGVQFHPEKSQRLGLAIIANFLRWRP